MGNTLVLALAAALNPTLVAASTVMMLLPDPVRLMFGYLLGALLTSITLGLLIIFVLEGSGAVSTTKNALSPAATIALGCVALAGALALGTERHRSEVGRRSDGKERKKEKGPPDGNGRWAKDPRA